MTALATLRRSVGPLSTIMCLLIWVGGGYFLIRAAVDGLWEYPRFSEWLVKIASLIVGVGGLVWFWLILAQVEFWQKGYRVTAISPKEWLRWSLGPKQWAYEERASDGRVLRLPFVRVILESGYPARSELRFPSEKVWDVQVPDWAQGRRAEILQRVVENIGGSKYVRVADLE